MIRPGIGAAWPERGSRPHLAQRYRRGIVIARRIHPWTCTVRAAGCLAMHSRQDRPRVSRKPWPLTCPFYHGRVAGSRPRGRSYDERHCVHVNPRSATEGKLDRGTRMLRSSACAVGLVGPLVVLPPLALLLILVFAPTTISAQGCCWSWRARSEACRTSTPILLGRRRRCPSP